MKQCKDCKYYSITDKPSYSWKELDAKFTGECTLGSSKDGEPNFKPTKAFALDGEEYGATMLVAKDFGCVQFEENCG